MLNINVVLSSETSEDLQMWVYAAVVTDVK